MKNDEWALTKELGRLRKHGFYMQVERSNKEVINERYNIINEYTREIIEPYCSIEEVLGIANVLDNCLEIVINYYKRKIDDRCISNNNSNNNSDNKV